MMTLLQCQESLKRENPWKELAERTHGGCIGASHTCRAGDGLGRGGATGVPDDQFANETPVEVPRTCHKLHATLGPNILARPGWDDHYYGDLMCGDLGTRAPWMVVPDNVDAKTVVHLIDRFWRASRPI